MRRETHPQPYAEEYFGPDGSALQADHSGGASVVSPERFEKNTLIRKIVGAEFNGEPPDVIFSFSGGIIEDEKKDQYRTLAYSDLNEHGLVMGSRSRVIATAEIAKAIPDIPIVSNSHNRFDPNEPTMASVVKSELVNRKVSPSRIIEEEKSFSTITQLIEMVGMAVANGWTKIAIVGNTWHFPRMREMYNRLDEIVSYEDRSQDEQFRQVREQYKKLGVRVNLISSEDIMRIASSRYGAYLDAAEQTSAFRKTLEAEARGLADLRAGKYRVTLQPEKPRQQ